MSCKHGNWSPCDECDAEDHALAAAYQRGLEDGKASVSQPEARGVEGMRNALEEIATVVHSDQSESDLETVLAWLASVVDPVLAVAPAAPGAAVGVDEAVSVKPVIVADWPDAHMVHLDVGVQHFTVGDAWETRDEAELVAQMLRTALTNLGLIPSALPRETLYAALRELIHRIEVCGASPELTNASSLACDLMDTVGNQFNASRPDAVSRVTAALAGKEGAK